MKTGTKLLGHFVSSMLTVTLLAGIANADDGNPPTGLTLAKSGILQPSQYTLEQLAAMFPAFKYASLDSAGFNAVSLPIHYKDQTGSGNLNEANAFAFLLSNALDWAPGCYCQRHAYFVFDRSRKLEESLVKEYAPASITTLIKSWRATHAIGGEIVKTNAGYTGTLEIYDPTGKRVDRDSFDDARSYFDLLGDMSVAAMKFFGESPNDALAKYLKTPRCKDPKSLVLLGSCAFQSQADLLPIMDQILAIDPDFSEVHSWEAAQLLWVKNDTAGAARERNAALSGYLASEDLRIFDRSQVHTLPPGAWDKCWQQAAAISPEDSPLRVMHSLTDLQRGSSPSAKVMDTAAQSCSKYPNNYFLLLFTAHQYEFKSLGRVDGDMAAGMYLTALRNHFMTGVGNKNDALVSLARMVDGLGRPDIVAQLLYHETPMEPRLAEMSIDSLCDMGQYQKAVGVFKAQPSSSVVNGLEAFDTVYAAAMVGDAQLVDKVLSQYHKELETAGLRELGEAYRDLLAGKAVDVQKISDFSNPTVEGNSLQLLSQLDLKAGTETYRDHAVKYLDDAPYVRPLYVLVDAYDRQHARPEMADFYRSIQWLYPDDAWCTEIAAQGLDRHKDASLPDPAALEAVLKCFPPNTWSPQDPRVNADQLNAAGAKASAWVVVSAIRELSDSGDFKRAKELARRYANFCAIKGGVVPAFWATHLAYRVDECERAKAGKN